MFIEVEKYIAVFLTSMFKFVFGPLLAAYEELSVTEAALLTILGTMTTVVILTVAGEKFRKVVIKKFYRNRKLFTSKTRKRVKFIRTYGLKGVAFLTPVVFGPIIGPLIASSMGESKRKVVTYMFASCVFWAFILSIVFHHSISYWHFPAH